VGTRSVGFSNQGNSVAVSADGNTLIVGGPGDSVKVGAAWIFANGSPTFKTATPMDLGGNASPCEISATQEIPDRLVVTKTRDNLNNPGAPRFSKTITDQSLVHKLYEDMLTLPLLLNGPRSCPSDMGIRYRLDWYLGANHLLAADYDPTGCASVKTSDGRLRGDPTGNFEIDIRKALGFSPSDQQFLGLQ
jgi:hypothetical protein